MTLGSWFRDYVYIPLGGNRVSKGKWIRNIAIVWMLTGFWHGAQWNFVLWGVMFGILLAIEKLFLGKWLERSPNVIKHIYTCFIVLLSFAVFNANGLVGVANDFKGLFGAGNVPLVTAETIYNLKSYAVILIIAIIGCTPLPQKVWKAIPEKINTVLEPVMAVAILIVSTAFIINGSFNPFLYFRF